MQSGVATTSAYENDQTGTSGTAYNWIPINFYDSREGEPRDTRTGGTATNVSPIGVMNAVELDVGNLWLWLQSKAGTAYAGGSGHLVNNTNQNGYILYFSDRRGMQPDPDANRTGFYNNFVGISGLEDVVNSASAVGVPDNVLEPAVYYTYSPEDVDGNGVLDTLEKIPGRRVWPESGAAMSQPYYIPGTTNGIAGPTTAACEIWSPVPATCCAWWMAAWMRQALATCRSPLLQRPPGTASPSLPKNQCMFGETTTAGPADPFWPSFGANATTPHSAAAIIADAVTLLSPSWLDSNSFNYPIPHRRQDGKRQLLPRSHRRWQEHSLPKPAWGAQDFGTDGGMHNFLRYLEDRGGPPVSTTPDHRSACTIRNTPQAISSAATPSTAHQHETISSTRNS